MFGIKDNIVDSIGRKRFKKIADDIIDPLNPGEFNQAIMEFGALHCTPVNPKCTDCPFKWDCYAFLNNLQKEFPVKRKKNVIKNRYFHYLIIYHENQIMMKKRDGNDIWKGLYEFILIETKSSNKLTYNEKGDFYMKLLNLGERIEFISKEKIHLLSHQKIHGRFYHLPIKNIDNLNKINALKEFKFHNLLNINDLPKSTFITKYLVDAFF
jgi:A/G-specific adenine glycosylase